MNMSEKILKALENVYDPEIHKSLPELGMVGNIEEEDGNVLVNISLTTPKCPLKSTIAGDVKKEVMKIEGVRNVDVAFGDMDQKKKEALMARLRGGDERDNPLEGVKMIAIGSGKGGVGKSSVTAGIAAAMVKMGKRVGLIDADILGYSIPQIIGIKHVKPVVIEGGLLMPIEKEGIKIISMGNLIEKDEAFIWRGPMLARALQQFIYDVYWGELDVMLIDMPPGTGDVPLNIMKGFPGTGIAIVTTPQEFVSGIAKRLGLMAKAAGCRIEGVIENMSYFICENCGERHYLFGRGNTEEVCRQLETTFLGSIPFVEAGEEPDAKFRAMLEDENSKTARALKHIAQKLTEGC